MVSLGMSHSKRNYARCFDNCGTQAEDVPTLKLLAKVHKPPGPTGLLQSRPVVTASASLSSRAGDILSDILEPMVALQRPMMEDLSSEEVLAQLKEAQEAIAGARRRDTTVGLLDVKALYPSLDQEESAEAVAKFVRESTLDGVDWRQTQLYVVSNMDPHELKRERVEHLVPGRTKSRGPRPGGTTEELRLKRKMDVDVVKGMGDVASYPSKWMDTDPDRDLSESEKRLLLSVALKIATRVVFKHHCYQFDGRVYRQVKGGPIGLRLTSVVSRIVMDMWILGFISALV